MRLSLLFTLIITASAAGSAQVGGQPTTPPAPEARPMLSTRWLPETPLPGYAADNKDDPGYDMYKSGYSLILNEQWEEACERFRELLNSFPESRYTDDAMYWTAYARSHHDQFEDALDAYQALIEEFPNSQYFDDAVADMAEIEQRSQINELRDELEEQARGLATQRDALRNSREERETIERQYRRLTWQYRTPTADRPELDPETQLRIEALRALEQGGEDPVSLQILREVALDKANPVPLRVNAVEILSESDMDGTLPVLVSLVKDDTSMVRHVALEYIAQAPEEKSVDALIDVFQYVPDDGDINARVFYMIAEVGNDKAVDFLAVVASTNNDIDLRREAVYYLGAIGSERARTALRVILQGK